MRAITKIEGTVAVLKMTNIDTDQIIPSEYLKTTTRSGLGKHLFHQWRFDQQGRERADFVLNRSETRKATILVAGDNFGCGSSREHAPWALLDFGITVVISSSFADIFCNNAIKNGLLPIRVDTASHQLLQKQNAQQISVDLEMQQINLDGNRIEFELEAFARYCLLNGINQLDFLLQHQTQIEAFEQTQAVYR